MRRLLAILVPVLVAGVVATEMAMDLDAAARNATYRVYAVAALLAVALYLAVRWFSERAGTLAWSLALVGLSTVAVAAVAVVLAANSMFFSAHDRDVLLVVLGVGIALAAALAAAIGRSLVGDLRRVQATARRVGAGELGLRTDVSRGDEVGDLASAMDRMIERLETTEEERKILLASVDMTSGRRCRRCRLRSRRWKTVSSTTRSSASPGCPRTWPTWAG